MPKKKKRRNKIDIETVNVEGELTSNLTFEEAVQTFITEKRLHGLSHHTIDYYKQKLNQFKRYYIYLGKELEPQKVELSDIKDIMRDMSKNKKQVSTINAFLRAIRAFFNFLDEEGYLIENPVENLKLIKEEKKVIPTFSKEQIKKLLSIPDKKTFAGYRDYVIMLFLFETGIRLRELTEMELDDLNFKDGLAKVHGKNGEERYVPFQETVKREINKYLNIRGKGIGTNALWINHDNKPISRRMVQQALQYYGKRANIKNVRVSPHTFRHTFAKMAVQNGANIFALQSVLGHSDLDMVKRYVNLFSSEVYDLHKKFSPIQKLFE